MSSTTTKTNKQDLPDGFRVSWAGTDSTTPDGCFAYSGLDAVGNRTDLLYRGDDVAFPEDAVFLGRVVWTSTGNTIYQGWNYCLGADRPADVAFASIIAAHDRNA